MNKLRKVNISLPIAAAAMLWIKTYIVYKTSFNIKIENFMQELILFINPLSFLLFAFGVALFFKVDKSAESYILSLLVLYLALFYTQMWPFIGFLLIF